MKQSSWSREITIHALDVVSYVYPELVLDIECSSGTYVRSLGRDLAASLGTAAVMSALVRTAIGEFTLEAACPLDELNQENWQAHLLPIERGCSSLARVVLSVDEARHVSQGRFLPARDEWTGQELAAFDTQGRLVSILDRRADGHFGPRCNFVLD